MEFSEQDKETFRQLALSIESFKLQIQEVTQPLQAFLAEYEKQMKVMRPILNDFSENINRVIRESLEPVFQEMSSKGRLDIQVEPTEQLLNKINDFPRKVETLVPEIADLQDNSLELSSYEQSNGFTWRDLISILSFLIALASFAYDVASDQEARNEINKEVNTTVNYFINNYNISFPDDQLDLQNDQP